MKANIFSLLFEEIIDLRDKKIIYNLKLNIIRDIIRFDRSKMMLSYLAFQGFPVVIYDFHIRNILRR